MRISLFTLSAFCAGVLAVPKSNYVQHEKRASLPRGWRRLQTLPAHEVLPMRIALTQSNLDQVDEFLRDVSHPDSPNYGKHWTTKQVAEAFAPSEETVQSVMDWVKSVGISSEKITKTQSMGWLTFDATVGQAEDLLKTEFFRHVHTTGKPHIGCDGYHIPEHLVPHIDFVTPTVHFDTKIAQAVAGRAPSSTGLEGHPIETQAAVKLITNPNAGFLPKKGATLDSLEGIVNELKNCNKYIVPDCLRVLYRFRPGLTANPKNSYGIVEYTPQSYLQGDLNQFFANFSQHQVQKTPTLQGIDGGAPQTANQGFGFNAESDLDLEYAMTLINPQKVTLYQVGDSTKGASFNNFLDALDGSYCTFEGGDDPSQDGAYPDPFGGYQGPEACGGYAATKVISTSYAFNELDLTPFYEQRQCSEYAKLGLLGTSFLYSSGDFGVAGNKGQCIGADGKYNNGSSGRFNPSFPATCPYITAVGATQIKPNATVLEAEKACETVIFSGGGFSNNFALPAYQAAAVKSYFTNHKPNYTTAQYNDSQTSRGFPDISANGANYVVAVDGQFSLVYGTSAAAPVVGSILTLINEARYNLGKGSIGFINPTLYKHPGMLNDIVSGSNPGCGTKGFSAVRGWDPVTGLGTPNYPRMLRVFLRLP